jgi:hypothetical protein
MVVDSCLDTGGKPLPTTYLSETLGVDLADVVLVVGTHWHDDHVGGLAQVVTSCPNARFVCSGALETGDFLALVLAGSDSADLVLRSGVREWRRILHAMEAAVDGDGPPISRVFAFAAMRLFQRAASDDAPDCEVWALSPSAEELNRAYGTIGELLTTDTDVALAVPPPPTNDTAVALWVRVGSTTMLLGSDLEHDAAAPACGWQAVLDNPARPIGRADLIKVPHHGSVTGHHDDVWSEMAVEFPVAVLTPFRNGSVRLPTPADRDRICALVSGAWTTLREDRAAASISDRTARKTAAEGTRWIRRVPRNSAFVRLRRAVGSAEWQVEADEPAGSVCEAQAS